MGSEYACIEEGIIEDVSDSSDIRPIEAGGLPVPEIDAPDIEGESEYERPSLEMGPLTGVSM